MEIFEHDVFSRDFLMEVVTHFVRIEGGKSENHEIHKRLKTIHGVGDVRASELAHMGIRNVDDLRDMLTQNHKVVPTTVTRVLPLRGSTKTDSSKGSRKHRPYRPRPWENFVGRSTHRGSGVIYTWRSNLW